MKVQILVDNINSWVLPYAKDLVSHVKNITNDVSLIHSHEDIEKGDILVLLSCEQILKKFDYNKHNLVVHASDLPKGRGWSPLTYAILEGKNDIPVTLFEAVEKVDAGKVYAKEFIHLEGHELIEEARVKLALKSNELILNFIADYPAVEGKEQEGEPTFYAKRKPSDSELDITKSIVEQINLFRVSDNERYPAYFFYKGFKYTLKIEKHDQGN